MLKGTDGEVCLLSVPEPMLEKQRAPRPKYAGDFSGKRKVFMGKALLHGDSSGCSQSWTFYK